MTVLWISLIGLVLMSAFFSSAETGMMSINRYRLRHNARKGHRKAMTVSSLLERPDRLLGVILIGNTAANIIASSIATILAVRYFGEMGVIIATVVLTLAVLLLGETTPKTLAALYPERVAYAVAKPLKWLMWIFYPLVWAVNSISNTVLGFFRIKVTQQKLDPLTTEEIRTLINEATGKVTSHYQTLLLRILELENIKVEDVMVPRGEVSGLDLNQEWSILLDKITQCEFTHLPVYRDSLDNCQGILDIRKVWRHLADENFSKAALLTLLDAPYLVPEGTTVSVQLKNFQQQKVYIGLVVDEYGDIKGLINLKDIVEEIVGEFSSDLKTAAQMIRKQKDGSYLVEATVNIRDLIRITHWHLPIDGPKTLSGLIIEHLEMIPSEKMGLRLAGYPMEVISVDDNIVHRVRVYPKLYGLFEES